MVNESLQNNIKDRTKKSIEELIFLSLESKIKLDKKDFSLTNFIRENIVFFVNKLEKSTTSHIDFIYKFLLHCGIEEQKNTITTIYNRVKKELINKEVRNEK